MSSPPPKSPKVPQVPHTIRRHDKTPYLRVMKINIAWGCNKNEISLDPQLTRKYSEIDPRVVAILLIGVLS